MDVVAGHPLPRRPPPRLREPLPVGQHAFVFNGLLSSVSLSGGRRAGIDAQRLASLLASLLGHESPAAAVSRLYRLLCRRARAIPALNLALCGAGEIVFIFHVEAHPEYYQLHHAHDDSVILVCSQALSGFTWLALPQRSVATFNIAHVA